MTEIVTIRNGPFKQNCYLVIADNCDALVIDPGSEAERIKEALAEAQATPLAVLNTHAHFDHVGAVADLCATYSIPFYLHVDDTRLLTQANLYMKVFGGRRPIKVPAISHTLSEGGAPYEIGGFLVEIIDTPGHTQGSICIRVGNEIFVGDTILANGIGRADLPGGSLPRLRESVKRLVALVGPDDRLWPGHGRSFGLKDMKMIGNA